VDFGKKNLSAQKAVKKISTKHVYPLELAVAIHRRIKNAFSLHATYHDLAQIFEYYLEF
jgi:hypothetical protein